ncbi:uncharacterized protein EV420DRAFT_1486185 [Desarmillaria tabescens]|uniref:Uncharacterized protein n=1 Tax=Armillaria tabescens TaxID=1929756 RepID=A0AA39JBJ5_ARMTA|nr:uncharacterized protein EV420DRAFT_1486185 [Desarmillaria tabescens]KAK0439732.1 hypothetical protein EV420DRAFT_1486185 [Desarmillaria tabescens]
MVNYRSLISLGPLTCANFSKESKAELVTQKASLKMEKKKLDEKYRNIVQREESSQVNELRKQFFQEQLTCQLVGQRHKAPSDQAAARNNVVTTFFSTINYGIIEFVNKYLVLTTFNHTKHIVCCSGEGLTEANKCAICDKDSSQIWLTRQGYIKHIGQHVKMLTQTAPTVGVKSQCLWVDEVVCNKEDNNCTSTDWAEYCVFHYNDQSPLFQERAGGDVDLQPRSVGIHDNVVVYDAMEGLGGHHPELYGYIEQSFAVVPIYCPYCVFDGLLTSPKTEVLLILFYKFRDNGVFSSYMFVQHLGNLDKTPIRLRRLCVQCHHAVLTLSLSSTYYITLSRSIVSPLSTLHAPRLAPAAVRTVGYIFWLMMSKWH